LGVAAVEDTREAAVLVEAMGEVEAVGARGAGEAIEIIDVVEAGDVG
jgi:hypothetical protein